MRIPFSLVKLLLFRKLFISDHNNLQELFSKIDESNESLINKHYNTKDQQHGSSSWNIDKSDYYDHQEEHHHLHNNHLINTENNNEQQQKYFQSVNYLLATTTDNNNIRKILIYILDNKTLKLLFTSLSTLRLLFQRLIMMMINSSRRINKPENPSYRTIIPLLTGINTVLSVFDTFVIILIILVLAIIAIVAIGIVIFLIKVLLRAGVAILRKYLYIYFIYSIYIIYILLSIVIIFIYSNYWQILCYNHTIDCSHNSETINEK